MKSPAAEDDPLPLVDPFANADDRRIAPHLAHLADTLCTDLQAEALLRGIPLVLPSVPFDMLPSESASRNFSLAIADVIACLLPAN